MKITVFWEIPANGEETIDIYNLWGISDGEWSMKTELEKHEFLLEYVQNMTGVTWKEDEDKPRKNSFGVIQ